MDDAAFLYFLSHISSLLRKLILPFLIDIYASYGKRKPDRDC